MKIYSLWIGDELPLIQRIAAASWAFFDCEYHLFTYQKFPNVPDGVVLEDANRILPEDKIVRYKKGQDRGSPSLFANIFRYKYLAENGGCWADADTVALAPPPAQPIFFSSEALQAFCTSPAHANFALVKVPAKTDLMTSCYTEATKSAGEAAWGVIGPKLLFKHIKRCQLEQHILPAISYCPIPYRNAKALVQTPPIKLPDACLGVHVWNQTLKRQGVKTVKLGGLLERLRNRFMVE